MDSLPKLIFYWFILIHISLSTPGEREVDLKYHHSASRHRQLSIILCYEKESELDSFKWLLPQALFPYLCWFPRCWQSFWFLITYIIFLKVKVFRILVLIPNLFERIFTNYPFFVRNFKGPTSWKVFVDKLAFKSV